MNIYLISQDINREYDTFNAAVVAAESEQDARTIHPSNYTTHHNNNKWMGTYTKGGEYEEGDDCWIPFSDIDKLKVKLIGTTNEERGVILSSFNAG